MTTTPDTIRTFQAILSRFFAEYEAFTDQKLKVNIEDPVLQTLLGRILKTNALYTILGYLEKMNEKNARFAEYWTQFDLAMSRLSCEYLEIMGKDDIIGLFRNPKKSAEEYT